MSTGTINRPLPWLFLALMLVALPSAASAQSGRLAGVITETGTNLPLPGATVLLEGTQLGSVADDEGRYVVVGVTPGTYSVRVSFVGYTPQVTQIRVTSDVTTSLNVALTEETQVGNEVQVIAERPVVDPNETASRSIVTGDEMERLPVANLQDVIARTANSYQGFVRGSRRFETRTIIDGVDVSDQLTQVGGGAGGFGAVAGGVYNNVNRSAETNPQLFNINPEGVEEVTVNTGATDPRYGASSGGIVAVTLNEGRGPIRGTASFRVAPGGLGRPGPDSLDFYSEEEIGRYNVAREARLANADSTDDELFVFSPDRYTTGGEPEYDGRFSLGGSIAERLHFFATGQAFQTNGYQPNQFQRRLSGQLKTTYDLGRDTRVSLIGLLEDRGLWGDWNNRSYNDYWRYYLEGVAQNDGGSYMGSFRLTQILSATSFLEAQAYQTYQRSRYGYVDDNGNGFTDPGEDGEFIDFTDPMNIPRYIGVGTDRTRMFYANISDSFADIGITNPNTERLRAGQPAPYSEDASQRTNGFRVSYNHQVTPNHYVQAGTELKRYHFTYASVQGLDQTGNKLNEVLEPFAFNDWERRPSNLGVYASDRMEYGGLILNLGARLEFVDRDMELISDFFHPFRRDTVEVGIVYRDSLGQIVPSRNAQGGVVPRRLPRNNFVRGADVPMDIFFNPSIGVSHPIGTTASIYFSFSRNSQLLPFSTLYANYNGNNSNSVSYIYQDPEQRPITANNYELGGQWEFARGWGLDLNAYMRSIDNYGQALFSAQNRNPFGTTAASEPVPGLANHVYATSAGYADSRGVELTIRRRPLQLADDITLGLTGSYTFSTIEVSNFAGTNVTGFADLNPRGQNTRTLLPFENAQNFRNFPQQVRGGQSALTGGYGRSHRFVLRSVAALPYDVSVGLTSALDSGFLYPRVVDADPRDRALLTGPTNFQLDLRLEKRFPFGERFGADVFVDVTNLTNQQNIVAYDNDPRTGAARVFQLTGVPGTRLIQPDGTALYGPSRALYVGTRVRF